MSETKASRFSPLPAGSRLQLDSLTATLGPALELEAPGFVREAEGPDGKRYRLLELPAQPLSVALAAAFTVPGVAAPVATFRDETRQVLALRPAAGPRLDWLLRRNEGLPLWGLDLTRSLARLFQAVHEAGLAFARVIPSMFSVAPDGSLHLEEPEQLRRPADPAPREEPTLFTAPEVLGGASGDARSDQYSLGLLAYALISGRLPQRRGELPLPRIYRPWLPHGVATVLARATRSTPRERYESCRAFLQELETRSAPRGGSPRSIVLGAATELGRIKGQAMPVNQDAWFYGYDPTSRRGLLLVADGVSTADVGSGDLAANYVREAVKQAWEGPVGDILRGHKGTLPEEWGKAALEAILEDANARIYAYLKQPIFLGSLTPGTHPPGSTAVLGLLDGDRLTLANVGDSRLYLLRDGALEQMTVDHDLRTELLQSGRDPSNVDPSALGALTQSVGSFFFDPEGGIANRKLEPDVQFLFLNAGDRVLFCSDGIPDCLGDGHEAVITRELAAGTDAQRIAERLCRLADEALGADNMTALVLLAN